MPANRAQIGRKLHDKWRESFPKPLCRVLATARGVFSIGGSEKLLLSRVVPC